MVPPLRVSNSSVSSAPTPFTFVAYAERLKRTAAAYRCVTFDVLADPAISSRRFCLVRHDIDMSPAAALSLARIEAKMGVTATYAVLLTGPFYNPHEATARAHLQAIAGLGHAIAVHFDAAWHGIKEEQALEDAVAADADALRRLLEVEVSAFSFHNTTDFTMACSASSYGGLWNAYAAELQDHVSYVSDSNGYWRFDDWDQALREQPERLQILTHPEWWNDREATPAEKVCELIEERSRAVWRDYDALLRGAGRENRSDIPTALEILQHQLGTAGEDLVRRWLSGAREEALLAACRQLNIELRRRGRPPAHGTCDDVARRLLAGESVEREELAETFRACSKLLLALGRNENEF
ncbi:MAG TPA: hypothetical protein VGX37_03970 [Allosphingosinicella sp.]|jgi:hypothetical protein|nr:hypothetical protein [Allosphingosinicella sp.]